MVWESYGKAENVDLEKRFWWERLPILKHLVTKRAFSKHVHLERPILDQLLKDLGYKIKKDKRTKCGFRLEKI